MVLHTFKMSDHLVASLIFIISFFAWQEIALSQNGYPIPLSSQMGTPPISNQTGALPISPPMMARGMAPPHGQVQPIFYGNDAGTGAYNHPVYAYGRQEQNPEMVMGSQYASQQPRKKKGYTSIPGAYFRMEYISWNLKEPGTFFLGEQRSDRLDLSNQALLSNSPLQGQVLSTNGFSFENSPGFRATTGIPLIGIGAVEMSAFVIGQSTASNRTLPQTLVLPGNTFLSNGTPGTFFFGYDNGASVSMSTRLWGASILLIKQYGPPGEGFKLQPLGGIKYFALRDKLNQNGDYTSGVDIAHSVIEADTINHSIGLTAGVRAEFVHRWVTLGIEPRVTIGGGWNRTRVNAQNILSIADPLVSTSINGFAFTPMFEVGAYARVHPTENITISVGFDYMAIANMTRAYNSLRFDNVNGVGVVTARNRSLMFDARGFNFSVEWMYR
ncbi:hypothetical protein MNBD_PLANCTO02-310 [hydrothermal vent metagenome]|uniref:Uncharacterized protein n=1 Tax=hydrothermal vent metagenome TaxID=652676 RepID=A0A3B1E3A8_9ZZZZ